MRVIEEKGNVMTSLPARLVSEKQIKAASSPLAKRILDELAKEPQHPRALAKLFRVHEQKIYYHIRKLEKARLIEIIRKQEFQGTTANIYSLTSPAFVLAFKEFSQTHKSIDGKSKSQEFFEPIIDNGELNGVIVVGSPDPHGPEMARSRDGYYGIDLALFLGTFLSNITELSVRLDTEVRKEDLEKNLILLGGPVVNIVTSKINDKLPLRFNANKNWAIESDISNKTYHEDSAGIIVKVKNPFNLKKWVLVVAGKRYSGTRAVMIAFLKRFDELVTGNKKNPKIHARVVEGLDRDADGIVDDVEFVE